MSLKKIVLEAVESKGYCEKKALALKEKTFSYLKEDNPGVWMFDKTFEHTLESAKKLDQLSADEKNRLKLFGLSVGVKDLFCVKNIPTTAGSQMLSTFIPTYDSTVWKQMIQSGAFYGVKASMDEFAMGSFTNTSYLGKTSIPGMSEFSAGGSSGGSAAVLKADLVDFSLGSDTGGSVRQPAAFCGLVGYKPSYGAFSRYGMIAYASSLDQAGILTHSIDDLEYILSSISLVADPKDPTCEGITFKEKSVKNLYAGFYPELLESDAISEEIKQSYQKELEYLKQSGVELTPVSHPMMKHVAEIYYVIACAEACSNLSRYQGVYFGHSLVDHLEKTQYKMKDFWDGVSKYRTDFFGTEVQKRIMLGSYIMSSEKYDVLFMKAKSLRAQLSHDFEQSFKNGIDFLVLPTTPYLAPKWSEISKKTTSEIYLADYLTTPFSLAGLPVIAKPAVEQFSTLSCGLQFVGSKGSDLTLLKTLQKIYQ